MFDAAKVAEDMRIWWENGSGDKFILEQGVNGITTWSTWNETKVVKLMRSNYVRLKARENETIGEVDRAKCVMPMPTKLHSRASRVS